MHLFHYTLHHDKRPTLFSTTIQVGLIALTLIGTMLIALELPEYGIVIQWVAQIFWLYNTYIIYRDDNTQWGMFVLSIIMALVIWYGILNYWYLT